MKRNSIDTRSDKRYLRHTTKSRIERSPGAGRVSVRGGGDCGDHHAKR
ncbi:MULTISPECIES: hypothetical protein [Rhizobium]|uniref:Uncharacterized protein n=1 Tax=Rhizobium indicum TaxID=2583231 RepID=A0ABX6PNS0_9HYPH|nr:MULTISPECIES: hypothetical protein [Rhizobium]NNU68959.1 hypothetical protein [Rhizobium sp. WYCCWR 11152]QKK20276.1 hypothetical protein FFM53_028020 [Rhizobium indicum]